MRQKMWIYSPPKPKVPDGIKVELERKATELINTVLKPEHVKPPPKNMKWNYIVDLYTKWHRNYFCFCITTAILLGSLSLIYLKVVTSAEYGNFVETSCIDK